MSTNSRQIVITAGAAGIGRAITEAFLASGDRVHICDIDSEALHSFLESDGRLSGTVADVSNPKDVDDFFTALPSEGIDVLVNNAGIAGPTAPVEEMDIAGWNQTIATDLSGPFYVTRSAVPRLKASGGGTIINIASNAALFGFPLRSPYAAAKWGIIGLTKTWAMELGPYGIRVNAICPGSVNGPRIEGVIERDAASRGVSPDEIRRVYQSQSSMRTFVDAEEIAGLVQYLASDAGARISGQAIALDGHTEGLSNLLG